MNTFVQEIEKEHLKTRLIPFWESLRTCTCGYYGWLGYDLKLDKSMKKAAF